MRDFCLIQQMQFFLKQKYILHQNIYGSPTFLIYFILIQQVVIIIGAMQQNQPKKCLSAKIKCGIFKELFNQIQKNIKADKQFYMFLCKTGIQMTFMESGKQVQIQVVLNSQVFQFQYDYHYETPKVYKFSIRDLEVIGAIFENTSSILSLSFMEDVLTVSYGNQFSGECIYNITPLAIDEDQIPKQVGNIEVVNENQQNCTKIRVTKSKLISGALAAISLLKKNQCIQIQFISNQNKICIVPVPSNYGIKDVTDSKMNYRIPVIYQANPRVLDPVRFQLKKLKAALVFYDKNQQIVLTIGKTFLKVESAVPETRQKKNIMILIASYTQ